MKNQVHQGIIALFLLSTINSQLSTCFAQGSLTPPPGAPAPTMKSLDQVEARTIVNAANTPGDVTGLYNISQAGSYYLTTNLTGVSGKNGIKITANNVTLDLNGFVMQGVSGSSNGIWIPNASTNITIRNGTVSGWGTDGVSNTSSSAGNLVCERLNVSANNEDGIGLSGSGAVRDCNIQKNNRAGINCPGSGGLLISGCTASANGLNGINVGNGCNIKDCVSSTNGLAGIALGNNCSVKDCAESGNGYVGIEVGNNCSVKDCTSSANSSDGILVNGSNCLITGNTCSGNGSIGILIAGGQNRIDNNSVGNNTSYGIYPNNMNVANNITRNSSPGPGYGNFPGNNDYAPIGSPSTSTNPWQNFQ